MEVWVDIDLWGFSKQELREKALKLQKRVSEMERIIDRLQLDLEDSWKENERLEIESLENLNLGGDI